MSAAGPTPPIDSASVEKPHHHHRKKRKDKEELKDGSQKEHHHHKHDDPNKEHHHHKHHHSEKEKSEVAPLPPTVPTTPFITPDPIVESKPEEVVITATASAQVGSEPQVIAATPVVVSIPKEENPPIASVSSQPAIDTKPAEALTEQKIIKEMQEPAPPIPAPQATPSNAPKEPMKQPTLSELGKEYIPGARLLVDGALTPLFKMHSKAGNDWVTLVEKAAQNVRHRFGAKKLKI